MARMRSILQSDEGSISPLISIYFVIIMSSIFLISNIASIYIARRELINFAESSLAVASQELDEERYYYQLPKFSWNHETERAFVPIDCRDASETFRREIQLRSLSGVRTSKNGNTSGSDSFGASSRNLHSGDLKPDASITDTNADSISILNFRCDGTRLRARISSKKALMFSFPALGIRSFENQVEVGISTTYLK